MKTVVLESSLRKIVREELVRYINKDKQEQVLEEGKLQKFLSGLALVLGLGSGGVGAKLTSELPATTPTIAAMQSVAGDTQLGSDFDYDQNTKQIMYKKKAIGSISPETENLIKDYWNKKDANARDKFLKQNELKMKELETIFDNSDELKSMLEAKRLTGIALLAALVLLIGGSMGLTLASEGGPATGLYAARGVSSVRRPKAPYGTTG